MCAGDVQRGVHTFLMRKHSFSDPSSAREGVGRGEGEGMVEGGRGGGRGEGEGMVEGGRGGGRGEGEGMVEGGRGGGRGVVGRGEGVVARTPPFPPPYHY